ncbi:unnamed protein product [Penicillium egyptiacum]|uniref:Uncharacterized protein n=1 Tax=Penicillium egyptiacum TaxID=1303716 RepID=A0A9W4KLP2_9EURO|nr:unnamed protein product [Penicillium egyptiacum]
MMKRNILFDPSHQSRICYAHTRFVLHFLLRSKCQRSEGPWTSKCVGESAFENSGLYKHDQPEFGCYHIAELNDPAYPHVKAVMYNNLVATDSTVLYGELIPTLRIMLTQLRKRKFMASNCLTGVDPLPYGITSPSK